MCSFIMTHFFFIWPSECASVSSMATIGAEEYIFIFWIEQLQLVNVFRHAIEVDDSGGCFPEEF